MVVVSFFGVGVTDFFLQRTQELEKGGGEGHGAVGYRTGCAHVGGQKSSRKKIELF